MAHNDGSEIRPLLVDKHERYFRMCMKSFPSKVQSEDSNKLALIYFCLHGLDIIGRLNLTQDERTGYSKHIYDHLIVDPLQEIQSFRPSQTFELPAGNGKNYDLPNLSATLFALSNLLALESKYSDVLDCHKMMRFVQRCQVKSGVDRGSFKPVLDKNGEPFGETDLRHCYIAAKVRKMCKYDQLPTCQRRNDINVLDLIEFILQRVNFNGGLSSSTYTESHSGLTFCGLATLKLLDYDFSHSIPWVETTKNWLVHRQIDFPTALYKGQNYEYWDTDDIGGFNGRENKFGDTCYSWWCTSSLKLLDPNGLRLIDLEKATQYLLNSTQNKLLGGFGKDGESFPDPFHSFLGLASLSLWKSCRELKYSGEEFLSPIDETLMLTERLERFFNTHIRF